MSIKLASFVALALVIGVAVLPSARADTPPFVFPNDMCCFYNGGEVRTVVPPAAFPNQGRDNFYGFPPPGGAEGQKGVVAVAPGDIGYHGGQWKFYAVTWNAGSTPSLLMSGAAVLAAEGVGPNKVTVTRVPAMDFLCPIQF